MSILTQKTVSKKISFSGIGIHSGNEVNLNIKEVKKPELKVKRNNVAEVILPDLNLRTETVIQLFKDVDYDLRTVINEKLVKTKDDYKTCMNDKDNEAYYFPICESENRDNNYKRVKDGMRFFKSKGWLVYKIQ